MSATTVPVWSFYLDDKKLDCATLDNALSETVSRVDSSCGLDVRYASITVAYVKSNGNRYAAPGGGQSPMASVCADSFNGITAEEFDRYVDSMVNDGDLVLVTE